MTGVREEVKNCEKMIEFVSIMDIQTFMEQNLYLVGLVIIDRKLLIKKSQIVIVFPRLLTICKPGLQH